MPLTYIYFHDFFRNGRVLWFCNVFVCSRYCCLQRVHIPFSIHSVLFTDSNKKASRKAMMRTWKNGLGPWPNLKDVFMRRFIFSFLYSPQSNFSGALASYEKALSVSAQREVRLLCLHEVGWSYVLLLHWDKSSRAFLQLKRESRWSKSFYCYLSAG